MQTKLILTILALGFFLASTGQLEKVLHFVAAAAVDAQKHDLISLGKWNRTLNR